MHMAQDNKWNVKYFWAEHRALMEAAFVYGGKYQFVQTTGAPLLKYMG